MNNLLKHALLIIVSLSASIGVVQAAAPPSLADVMHDGSGSTGVRMLSLQDACVYASSTSATCNDFSLWDEIRRAYLPGIDPNSIQGYSEKNAASLRNAVLISLYVQRKFSDLFENRKALIDDARLMDRIDASYTPQFARALRGYLLIAAGRYAEVLQALVEAGTAVSAEAQQKLNEAARRGELGFDAVTGRAYLDARVLAGDQVAQEKLNEAAYLGGLGFNPVTGPCLS